MGGGASKRKKLEALENRNPMDTGWFPGKGVHNPEDDPDFKYHSTQKFLAPLVPEGGYAKFGDVFEDDPDRSMLGRGRLDGDIFTARRRSDKLRVAHKRVTPDRSSFVELQRAHVGLERLRAQATPKDCLVPVVASFVDKDAETLDVCTEVMEHGNFLRYLAGTNPWSEAAVKSIIKDILKALKKIHALGLVHRQVRLENVLAGSPDATRPLLGGFALLAPVARVEGESPDDVFFWRFLDYIYAAPELWGSSHDRPLDHAVDVKFKAVTCHEHPSLLTDPAQDVYAAGVLWHILLFGKSPVCASDDPGDTKYERIRAVNVERCKTAASMLDETMIGPLRATVGAQTWSILEMMLACDPRQRPTAEKVLGEPYFRDPLKHASARHRGMPHAALKDFIKHRSEVGRFYTAPAAV